LSGIKYHKKSEKNALLGNLLPLFFPPHNNRAINFRALRIGPKADARQLMMEKEDGCLVFNLIIDSAKTRNAAAV
jgi:hypothetical protein